MSEQQEPLFKDNPKLEPGMSQRRGNWTTTLAAISYINSFGKNSEFKTRQSDRLTSLTLYLTSIAMIICLVFHKLSGFSFQLTVLCDLILGISLIFYVSHRLGILTTLPPRQAALVWQLLKAFVFIGIFITVNLDLIIFLALSFVSSNPTHLR